MFGNDSKPSKIYAFGCQAPTTNGERVAEEIHRMQRYRNALCQLEHDRRARCDAALKEQFPDLLDLERAMQDATQAIEDFAAQLSAANAKARKRVATKADREHRKSLRAVRKDAAKAYRSRRKECFASVEWLASQAEIAAWATAEQKRLRVESGLYWGNYLVVEQAASSMKKGAPPKFHRWDREGKVAVQIQGGMTFAEAMGGLDTRLRIDSLPANAWDRGTPPRFRRTMLHVRIGSEGRLPVWASAPVTIHRPIPEDARIKWVYLQRRRVGTHDVWEAQLVLERAAGWAKPDLAASGRVAVDPGWRVIGDKLRVAYWVAADGEEGEVFLPMENAPKPGGGYFRGAVSAWQKSDDLQSVRDSMFDAIRPAFREWLNQHEATAWLRERTVTMGQWRSAARLAAVVIAWRTQRFAGDEEIFTRLEAWRKQDKHLYDWSSFVRLKAIRWRDDLYRNFAAHLRRKYHTVVLEDINWKDLAIRPTSDAEKGINQRARYVQRIAASGRLCEVLGESMEVVRVSAVNTTQRCHACGELCDFDAAVELEHVCEHCGVTWDQDRNACLNLLVASGEVVNGNPAPARDPQVGNGNGVAGDTLVTSTV